MWEHPDKWQKVVLFKRKNKILSGAYVPPPQQNFSTLPTVQNPGAIYDPNATIGDISAQMATAPALPAGAQIQPVGTLLQQNNFYLQI